MYFESLTAVIFLLLIGTFGITLAMAIVSGLVVFVLRDLTGNVLLGYLLGLPLFWIAAYFLLLKKRRPIYWYASQLFIRE